MAAIALVQLVGQSEGMYGFIEPGSGPTWAPTLADAVAGPGETALRPIEVARPTPHAWVLARPDRPRSFGTIMGGPGAFLAIGALGLPLALSITLQLMASGGSRDGMWTRLSESGQASLLVLLYASTIAGALLIGLFAGTALAIPFGVGITLVGVFSLRGTGLGLKGFSVMTLTLVALAGGVALGDALATLTPAGFKLPRVNSSSAQNTWSVAMAIARDFPVMGAGFGSFAVIEPYYKTRDAASSTAMSSLLQWWAESGLVGVVILGIAAVWGLARLRGAVRRVGSADRALVFGAIGAIACFAIVSCVHGTIELPVVALSLSAVAGTCNRWLAGGTDLFVERG